jgi:hypothetical protein
VGRIPRLGIDHVSLDHLLAGMWQIRDSINGYDAADVALAEARGLTLVAAEPTPSWRKPPPPTAGSSWPEPAVRQ